MPAELVTAASKRPAAPPSKAIREPPYLQRQLFRPWSTSQFKAEQWRTLIGSAPVVRACVRTLTMWICGISWIVKSEDPEVAAYFTEVLETADEGEGFEVHLSRVIEDALTVPFGGAVEIGAYNDGLVAWIAHLDGAALVPTYDEKFPYVQVDPWGSFTRPSVSFREEQIGRVRWQAQPNLKAYGWSTTPAMDALPAIQALMRADRFWQTFLEDSPPSGILEIMSMNEDEARSWFESWSSMSAGIDSTKASILHGGTVENPHPAQWIEFHKSPAELSMMEVLKLYAEEVTACFGLTIADLGIFGQEMRLAGAAKIMQNSEKQGIAKLMRAVKTHLDLNVLPDNAEFEWEPRDDQSALQRATAANMRSQSLATLARQDVAILTPAEAKLAAVHFDIIPAEVIEQAAELGTTSGTAITEEPAAQEDETNPTGVSEDDIEQRAAAEPNAFPEDSKPANKMRTLTEERLLKPALKGATAARLTRLINVGIDAWGKTEERSLAIMQRSRESAKEALEKALEKETWWKSPDLVDEVTDILKDAFEEGAAISMVEIEEARAGLGLSGMDIAPTEFNVTNKAVLDALDKRGGEFIKQIDDGTKRYITDAIMRGVQEGIGSPEIAKNILADKVHADLIDRWKNRTNSIVNTEINWSESFASLEQQSRLGLTKKVWVAISALACEICLAAAGKGAVDQDYVYDTATGGSLHTPGHPGVCLTGDARVLSKGIAAASERWYDGDLFIIRTASGKHLSCTPEHPILTDHGWVAARNLVEGGYVVSSLSDEWVAISDDDDQNVPPRIEQIAHAFRGAPHVTTSKVPLPAKDLDGNRIGSEVAVIYADSLLLNNGEAAIAEHGGERVLCARHAGLPEFAGGGAPNLAFMRLDAPSAPAGILATADRVMGGGGDGEPFFPSSLGKADALAGAAVADRDGPLFELVGDGLAAYPVPDREAINRLAGKVTNDEIVEIQLVRDWCGQVYNLQTQSGFYVANGIVTHNCHCYMTFDKAELKALANDFDYWMGK